MSGGCLYRVYQLAGLIRGGVMRCDWLLIVLTVIDAIQSVARMFYRMRCGGSKQ